MSTSTIIPVSKEANKHLTEYDYGRLAGAFMYQSNIAQIARDLDLNTVIFEFWQESLFDHFSSSRGSYELQIMCRNNKASSEAQT